MTTNAPGPGENPRQQGQPDPSEQRFDARAAAGTLTHPERLRRSRSDRKLAGVCGGLGRQLGIDPTIIRVLMVVLALTGGIGVPLYVVLWILMPDEGSERSVLDSSAAQHLPPQVRSGPGLAILIAALVLVASGIFSGWWGQDGRFGFRLPLPLVAIGLLITYLVYRSKRNNGRMPAWVNRLDNGWAGEAGQPGQGAADGQPGQAGQPGAAPASAWADPADPDAPGPAFWSRPDPLGLYDAPAPVAAMPAPIVRKKRAPWSTVLGTLALAGASLAVLSIVGSAGAHVAPLLFVAVPTVVIGLGLVAAARRGGSRLLVTVAVILGLATVGATRFGDSFDGRIHELHPATAQQAMAINHLPDGYNTIDLRAVHFPNRQTTVHYTVDNGVIDVKLPSDLDVHVNAAVENGAWRLFDSPGARGGGGPVIKTTDYGIDGRATDKTRLDLDLTVLNGGLLNVERQK